MTSIEITATGKDACTGKHDNENASWPEARDKHFRTDYLQGDLVLRVARGGAITVGSQALKFLIRLVSTAILARMLLPSDFGLIAMVTVLTGFIELFKDAGLSLATIQKETITHEQVSTLFWINVALSLSIALLIVAISPVVAWFYADDRLVMVTIALSGSMLFAGTTVQHQALLRRQMKFFKLAIIEIVSMLTGIAVAIVMAKSGCSYWSLVAMTVTTVATTAMLSLLLSGWIPGRPRVGTGIKSMLKFGTGVMGFTFVNYFTRNADNFLLGWWCGAGSLGLYTRAYSILMLPLSQVARPIAISVQPALCRLTADPQAFQRTFLKAVRLSVALAIPPIGFLIGSAHMAIAILLGPGWEETAVLFQILGIAAIYQPLYALCGTAIVSNGNTTPYFRMGVATALPTLLAFIIALPYESRGMAVAFSTANVVFGLPIALFTVSRTTPVTINSLARMTLFSTLLAIPFVALGALVQQLVGL